MAAGQSKGTAVLLLGAVVLLFFIMLFVVKIVHFISAILFFGLYLAVLCVVGYACFRLIRVILDRWG